MIDVSGEQPYDRGFRSRAKKSTNIAKYTTVVQQRSNIAKVLTYCRSNTQPEQGAGKSYLARVDAHHHEARLIMAVPVQRTLPIEQLKED